MKKLPNFLCVGAQKAGTTTLHDILKSHSDIFLPKNKECKFFAHSEEFDKGLSYYQKEFFSDYNGEKVIGEIDPEYMYFDFVPERIYKTLGSNIKIIFILRNPASRAFSHYQMSLRRGDENLSFEKAVEVESERMNANTDEFNKIKNMYNFSYIERGYYAQQIKRYLKFFPIENMHFILFEDEFLKDREKTIQGVFEFLGVESQAGIKLDVKSNPASEPRSRFLRDLFTKEYIIKDLVKSVMPRSWRLAVRMYAEKINAKPPTSILSKELKDNILKHYYYDEIKELESIIHKNLSNWLIK